MLPPLADPAPFDSESISGGGRVGERAQALHHQLVEMGAIHLHRTCIGDIGGCGGGGCRIGQIS